MVNNDTFRARNFNRFSRKAKANCTLSMRLIYKEINEMVGVFMIDLEAKYQ